MPWTVVTRPGASHREETTVAKLASIVVKAGALVFALFVSTNIVTIVLTPLTRRLDPRPVRDETRTTSAPPPPALSAAPPGAQGAGTT
jgi:hypothetical protein